VDEKGVRPTRPHYIAEGGTMSREQRKNTPKSALPKWNTRSKKGDRSSSTQPDPVGTTPVVEKSSEKKWETKKEFLSGGLTKHPRPPGGSETLTSSQPGENATCSKTRQRAHNGVSDRKTDGSVVQARKDSARRGHLEKNTTCHRV